MAFKSISHRVNSVFGKKFKSGILMHLLVSRKPFSSIISTEFYKKKYMNHIRKVYEETKTPTRINIEATNLCNADCIMCPRSSHTRKQNIMSMELFKKIINDLSQIKTIKEVSLSGFGEPLIDKNIYEKITYAKKKGEWNTIIFTNGALLDENNSKKLIDSGLDVLNISFNGGSKEVYEEIMKLDFEKTKNNIEKFIELRNKSGTKKPYIIVSCILNAKNIDDEKPFRKMWGSIADQIIVVTPHNWMGGINSDIVNVRKMNPTSFPCRMIIEPFINWDGSVSLCCRDYNKFTDFGNLDKQSFMNIWNSEKYSRFRKNHVLGNFESICARCDIPYKEGPTKWWEPV